MLVRSLLLALLERSVSTFLRLGSCHSSRLRHTDGDLSIQAGSPAGPAAAHCKGLDACNDFKAAEYSARPLPLRRTPGNPEVDSETFRFRAICLAKPKLKYRKPWLLLFSHRLLLHNASSFLRSSVRSRLFSFRSNVSCCCWRCNCCCISSCRCCILET
jgi:hypothetical protein